MLEGFFGRAAAFLEIKSRRLHLIQGYSTLHDCLAHEIGLSKGLAAKRSQAVNVIRFFPVFLDMTRSRKITLTHLAMLVPQVTEANRDVVLENFSGLTNRALEVFLKRLTPFGELRDISTEEVEVRFTCSREVAAMIDEAFGLCRWRPVKAKTQPAGAESGRGNLP